MKQMYTEEESPKYARHRHKISFEEQPLSASNFESKRFRSKENKIKRKISSRVDSRSRSRSAKTPKPRI